MLPGAGAAAGCQMPRPRAAAAGRFFLPPGGSWWAVRGLPAGYLAGGWAACGRAPGGSWGAVRGLPTGSWGGGWAACGGAAAPPPPARFCAPFFGGCVLRPATGGGVAPTALLSGGLLAGLLGGGLGCIACTRARGVLVLRGRTTPPRAAGRGPPDAFLGGGAAGGVFEGCSDPPRGRARARGFAVAHPRPAPALPPSAGCAPFFARLCSCVPPGGCCGGCGCLLPSRCRAAPPSGACYRRDVALSRGGFGLRRRQRSRARYPRACEGGGRLLPGGHGNGFDPSVADRRVAMRVRFASGGRGGRAGSCFRQPCRLSVAPPVVRASGHRVFVLPLADCRAGWTTILFRGRRAGGDEQRVAEGDGREVTRGAWRGATGGR